MTKLAIIKIGRGDWQKGFPVTLQIGEEGSFMFLQTDGNLPASPEIYQYYQEWRSLYWKLPKSGRMEKPAEQITNSSEIIKLCRNATIALSQSLNKWLNSPGFLPLKERLLVRLNREDKIRVIIQTANGEIRRLPWHLWDFFEKYQYAEIALSSPDFEGKTKLDRPMPKKRVKILAIIGNDKGIKVDKDRKYLESLPNAEVVFLFAPKRQKIAQELWEKNWDILFFAGHSCTEKEKGIIYYNETESLSFTELKGGVKKAIEKGLKLAIFNSCDGLGLAGELEELSIPQVIVMREPVPDEVAQDFLKYFLKEFSGGNSLYMAVRSARERLHDNWESKIPGVSWLPVICQNLAARALVWEQRKPELLKKLGWAAAGSILFLGGVWLIYLFIEENKVDGIYEGDRSEIQIKYSNPI